MKFTATRESLLTPLQQIIGVIERRQTILVLANVLIHLHENKIQLTGSDSELLLVANATVESGEDGVATVPARKLIDIIRLLPDASRVNLDFSNDKVTIQSGRSRFSLGTLPASHYPPFDSGDAKLEFGISSSILKRALEKTIFSIALQAYRPHYMGLYLFFEDGWLRAVSSDGHRMAIYEEALEDAAYDAFQVIIPRKGVMELYRLLGVRDQWLTMQIAPNNIRVIFEDVSFAAKLIEARFPDFRRALPSHISSTVIIDKAEFKSALTRISIMANEKFNGIRLNVVDEVMSLAIQNPEHEEAFEELKVKLEGDRIDVAFNVTYLLDAVNNIDSEEVKLSFQDMESSCLIEDMENSKFKFIIMPLTT